MEGTMKLPTLALSAVLFSTPALAQFATVNDPAPGYASLISANYGQAEREIRAANVSAYDPARSINLGIALAKTGRAADAAAQFRSVLLEDEVELVLADGEMLMSHDVAQRALTALQNGTFSR
jgi:Flp pilus assembly protein TadD